jgi:hypothetical protein
MGSQKSISYIQNPITTVYVKNSKMRLIDIVWDKQSKNIAVDINRLIIRIRMDKRMKRVKSITQLTNERRGHAKIKSKEVVEGSHGQEDAGDHEKRTLVSE